MRKNNDEWVSASEIGRAAYCPHYLELKKKNKKVSSKAVAARQKGNDGHDELNKMAEDKRCYVASHLYGINDPRTELLRQFRDQHLVNNLPGKAFVFVYYRLSPTLVTIAQRIPVLDRPIRKVIDQIVQRIK